jgi:hypothetical protein
MGVMPGDILDLIDNVLADPFTSPDAMRCRNSAEFSLAMLPPVPVTGTFDVYPVAVTPAIAGIREGYVLDIDGRLMRVTGRTENPDGSVSFGLEAYEP